ncbi:MULTISPECIES: TetR/AcrR family transcriptional regulator [Nonomuraea]|uniref:TetR/AcrR family transcriptional regulator n=1 Tax=Nonomuraea salmonea TaxID=46181 RepID=A0ABV5NGH7_9ACTN
MPERQRADARRNYARILAVAEQEVDAHGAAASLEQIARVAGVGSATVRRHFPTRRALLQAVSHKRIDALCERADELAGEDDARAALLDWLSDLLTYCVAARGLAAALVYDGESESVHQNSCATRIEEAGEPLLRRAVQDKAVPGDVTVSELVALIIGIVLTTEHRPDAQAAAERLFTLTVAGISPRL